MQRNAASILKQVIAFVFPDRQTLQVFLLSLFVLLTIFSAGFYLNDEMEQATCICNMLHGDLTIEEIPENYYVFKSGIPTNPRYVSYGGERHIAASHGMSAFSAPFYYTLAAADFVMGIEVFFPLLWSITLGAFLYLSSGCIAHQLRKRWPDARDVEKKIRWLAVAAPAGLFAGNLWLLQPLSFELWGPPIAMQFMSLVVVSLGLAVLFRFFRYVFNKKIAFFGSFLLLVASPVAFWAIGQKYHGLNFALLVFAFASFIYGKKSERQRYHYGGYVFAALAVWVQLYSGAVILLSLLLVDLLTTRRRRLMNLLKVVVVVMVALTPYLVENYVLFDNPLYPGYIAKGNRNVIPPDPPEVTMLAPSTGASMTGNATVRYNVSSNAERSVIRFSSDGVNWTTLHTTTNHSVSFAWNTTTVSDGLGIVNVAARNWRRDRTARNVSVRVDNAPPTVAFVSPREGSVVAGNITLRCNLSSDVAVVDYWYSGGDGWTWLGNDTTPHDGFAWNTTGLQGTYRLKAVATDHVGFSNESQVGFRIDNSGRHLLIRQPLAGAYIGGNYTVDSVAPPGTTRIRYECLAGDTWQSLGVDDTPETGFVWNTSGWQHLDTALRATAYHDGELMETFTSRDVTVDNRKPGISITAPAADAEIRDVAIVSYNTSNNTAYVKVQYSTGGHRWQTAAVDYGASRFAFDATNLTGTVQLRATAVSRTGRNASASTSFTVAHETEMGALGRLAFIVNSLDVGWEFLKQVSALGEPEKIPWNLYKSFFNARGTEGEFAFFVFVPLFVLSLGAPLVYLRRRRRFGMVDGLMLLYIVLHLFIFVNISTSQGGGYDMRWYLPLYLPFLYFSVVTLRHVIERGLGDILKAYLLSLTVVAPAFLWVFWISTLRITTHWGNTDTFIKIGRTFGDGLVVVLLIIGGMLFFKKYIVSRRQPGRHWAVLERVFPSVLGVAMFCGSLMLFIATIIEGRGIPGSEMVSGTMYTMVVPMVRELQSLLHKFVM